MGIVNAVITEPIAIADIRAAISVSSNDLYTLSVSDKVNKFSKKKPYRGTSPTTPTYDASVGSDGAPAGTNPRWGLLVPTNTKEQLGTSSDARFLKPLAWRASGRGGGSATNIQNYTYLRLRSNTDFARMVDWSGYDINAPDPWSAGVSGATAHSNGTYLNVDTFDNAAVDFFLGRPSNASLGFKDFFVTNDYYFIAELYKNDQGVSGDTDVPEAVIVGTTKVADMAYGVSLSVKVSRIKQLLGFSGDGEHSLVAVTGISRITAVNPASYEEKLNGTGLGYAVFNTDTLRNYLIPGSGSLPPWTSSLRTFICDIKMQSYSKVEFVFLQYSRPVNGDPWHDMPTDVVTYHSDGIRFKMQARNVGSSAFVFNDSGNRNKLQLQARGNYDTTAPDYQSKCLSPGESKWRDVRVSNTANFTSTSEITLAAGATNSALYFHIDGVMPTGRTSGFTLRISTDGGNTWVITGSMAAVFEVPK